MRELENGLGMGGTLEGHDVKITVLLRSMDSGRMESESEYDWLYISDTTSHYLCHCASLFLAHVSLAISFFLLYPSNL